MSIEEVVNAWKSEEKLEESMPANPVGAELSDGELQEVFGGMNCGYTCYFGCHGDTTCGESVLV